MLRIEGFSSYIYQKGTRKPKRMTWYSLKKVERKQRKVREARTDMVYAASAFARVSAVCIFRPLLTSNGLSICSSALWGRLLNVVYTMHNSERKTTVQTRALIISEQSRLLAPQLFFSDISIYLSSGLLNT